MDVLDEFGEGWIFPDWRPIDVEYINWVLPEDRRIVTASLVKGVYQRERDRQEKKKDAYYEPQASFWWERFGFRHVKDIIDMNIHFHSIFGSIFEYKPHNNTYQHDNIPSHDRPPRYVIAFRGTLLKRRSFFKDLCLDAALILNLKTRYKTSLEPVSDKILEVGSENVWLAGHSLGAAIALQVGKTMAREGLYIETYLFNPPYCSSPIELLSNPILKKLLRGTRNTVIAGAVLLKSVIDRDRTTSTQEYVFNLLHPWIPYLFVNQNDPISCEYIGYFRYRERMESKGVTGIIERCTRMHSLISAVASLLYGGNAEALHQIPTGYLVVNRTADGSGSHIINQWLDPRLDLEAKLYISLGLTM